MCGGPPRMKNVWRLAWRYLGRSGRARDVASYRHASISALEQPAMRARYAVSRWLLLESATKPGIWYQRGQFLAERSGTRWSSRGVHDQSRAYDALAPVHGHRCDRTRRGTAPRSPAKWCAAAADRTQPNPSGSRRAGTARRTPDGTPDRRGPQPTLASSRSSAAARFSSSPDRAHGPSTRRMRCTAPGG